MKKNYSFPIVNVIMSLIIFITLTNCVSNTSKNKISNSDNETHKENPVSNTIKPTDNTNVKVLFSTQSLDTAKWYSPKEYPLKSIGIDGQVHENADYIIKVFCLNNYEIIIWTTPGGDTDPYILCVVKSGVFNINDGLIITPDWTAIEDNPDYCKKFLTITSNHVVIIKTEEKKEGNISKYENKYRINDKGDFYEVKE